MKIPRHKMPEQPPAARARNFNEVPLGYDAETAKMEAERCIQCKNPQCVTGCPVNVQIPEFIKLIREGDAPAAAKKIKETNALPAVCGRVCPQEVQCEGKCVLGKKGEPVAIGRLERYAADCERGECKVEIPKLAPSTGKKIAVIGSGPSGLCLAGDLALLGHEVTIYEALHKAGGVLVYGIPEFRLPKFIVESEVRYLIDMGVKLELNAVIGTAITIDDLFNKYKYDAIYIGVGAGLPKFMNMEGENLCGVYSANEYLTRANLMKAYDHPNYDTPIMRGRKVAVVGGGNVAMDCLRTAMRLGAERVYSVYRRAMEQMPARNEEIHHAEEEGIEFHLLRNPVKILRDDNGWVRGMEILKMELGEPDDSGRRRPVPIPGSEYEIEVDTVIIGIGADANPLLTGTIPDLKLNKWGYIEALEDGKTSVEGIWAGGDIVTGAATVIQAAGAGKTAAKSIHEYLTNKGDWPKVPAEEASE